MQKRLDTTEVDELRTRTTQLDKQLATRPAKKVVKEN